MGKASRRNKSQSRPTPVVVVEQPSARLVAMACVAILGLAAIPYGPFHQVPAAELWPLLVLLCASIMAGIPAIEGRLPHLAGCRITAEGLGIFIVLSTWLLLKLVGLHASGTDDNIYFYLANRMAQGAVPYRDFFFSHPPVHLLVPALLFKVFGFSTGLAKLIPVLAQTIAGLFLYLTLRRASVRMALAGLFIHFSAYQILMGSTDMNGENIMTMFLWASAWGVSTRRPIVGGVMSALALGTGMYALAGVIAIGVMAFLGGRKQGLWFAGTFVAVLTAIFVTFRILGGPAFTEGVFTYHTRKQVRAEGRESIFQTRNPFLMLRILLSNLAAFIRGDIFLKSFYYHGAIFILAITGAVSAWRPIFAHRERFNGTAPHHLALFGVVAGLLFMFQWAAVNEVYDFYLVPMISLLAPAAAYAVFRTISAIGTLSRPSGLVRPAVVLVLAWSAIPLSIEANAKMWPEEVAQKGEVVNYEWRDPAILAGPAKITKALFFLDHRVRGDITPFYHHYMWNKSLTFSKVDEIASYIRQNTTPDQTITGASVLAPLVALQAGRRIAGDEADTNGKRFNSGMLDERKFLETVCADRVAFVVSASNSFFQARRMAGDPELSSRFAADRTFLDPQLKHFNQYAIALFRVREGGPCATR